MKLRTGFVSNSSSSSFVIISEENWFKKCFDDSHPYTRHIINQLRPEYKEVLGMKAVMIEGHIDEEGYPFYDMEGHPSEEGLEDDWEFTEKREEAFHAFNKELAKDPVRALVHQTDR